jgi:hypothetical protein
VNRPGSDKWLVPQLLLRSCAGCSSHLTRAMIGLGTDVSRRVSTLDEPLPCLATASFTAATRGPRDARPATGANCASSSPLRLPPITRVGADVARLDRERPRKVWPTLRGNDVFQNKW